jgi:tRNA dimethylallyltransferase
LKDSTLFILGPTASGKSELALQLARERGGAILCLDAMQVYRDADIGTGKPTRKERDEIPHGGLDLVDIGQPFSVADYLQHAEKFLSECAARKQPIIIAGGTGLYYRALTQGLCEAPAAPPELKKEIAALSLEELQARLRKIDPEIIPHLDFKNPRRVARAIEVKEFTGLSLRQWQQQNSPPLVTDFEAYLLVRTKKDLDERIEKRVDQMLASGWKAEVDNLIKQYGISVLRNFQAIGYAELASALPNGVSPEIRAKIVTATRQYAKRQLTWFRRELKLKQLKLSSTNTPSSGGRLF